MLEHAKSTNSLLGKAFQKQIKTIEDAAEKKQKQLKVVSKNKSKTHIKIQSQISFQKENKQN